jgi:hypothetical protein
MSGTSSCPAITSLPHLREALEDKIHGCHELLTVLAQLVRALEGDPVAVAALVVDL